MKDRPLRVSRKHCCPVCRKPDWCTYLSDDTLAFCMRVESGSFMRASNGAFVHRLTKIPTPPRPRTPVRPPAQRVERASVEHLDAIYSGLLRLSPLSDAHELALRRRGFDGSEIARNRYGSTPSTVTAESIVCSLAAHDLRGVPGFFHDGQCWRMACCAPGFLIPVRDERGRIQALSYRLHRPRGGVEDCLVSR